MIFRILAESLDLSRIPRVGTDGDSSSILAILNIVWMVAGAASLLIITLAGFKYVISQGEPQAVAKAKDTIIYAVIGLVITIIAAAIVNFVFGNL